MEIKIPETPNTGKLLGMLRRYSSKAIEVRDIAELGLTYLGASKEYSNRIEVHLNITVSESVQEAVFIHELLHIIMHNQGFPGIVIQPDIISRLTPIQIKHLEMSRDLMQSTIDHLAIYGIMQKEFNLDFDAYFKEQTEAKKRKFKKFPNRDHAKDDEYFHGVQQLILDGLDYRSFPEPFKQEIMTLFKATTPEGFESSSALFKKVSKIGFQTPEQLFKCAAVIKDQLVHYGEKKSVGPVNQLYSALCVVRDARDIPLED